MATLAIAAVGAGASSAMGLGWSIGWTVGAFIGSALFSSSKSSTVEGQRLADLAVTTSAYGAYRKWGFGTIRMGGNIIWSQDIEEVRTESRDGGGKGGGGGGVTTVNYEYYCSFAVGFGEGPADALLQIYADGKLIYDATGTGAVTDVGGLKCRFHPGSETQLPDSLIEADVGNDDCPAYRGEVYVVFERLPLANFGNRIPNITATLTYAGDTLNLVAVEDGSAAITRTQLFVDWTRGHFYSGLTRFSYASQAAVAAFTTDGIGTNVGGLWVGQRDGLIYSGGWIGYQDLRCIDPDSMKLLAINDSEIDTDYIAPACQVETSDGQVFVVGLPTYYSGCAVWRGRTAKCLWAEAVSNNLGNAVGGAVGSTAHAYICSANGGSLVLHRLAIEAGALYDPDLEETFGITLETDWAAYGLADLIGESTGSHQIFGYDASDDGLILQVVGTNAHCTFKVDATTGAVRWIARHDDDAPFVSHCVADQNRIVGSAMGFVTGSAMAVMLDLSDGSQLFRRPVEVPDWDWDGVYTLQVWDGLYHSVLYHAGAALHDRIARVWFNRAEGGGATLADIVTTIAGRCGLEAGDLDVTGLAAVTVPGYMIGRPSTGRAALETLRAAYFFDPVEQDGRIAFVRRATSAVAARITQDDLAVVDKDTGEFLSLTITQEIELPRTVSVSYLDPDNDYEQNSQSWTRPTNPHETMFSSEAETVELAIAMTADTAIQIAQTTLYAKWAEREEYKRHLSWAWLHLSPTDLTDTVMDDGTVYATRITNADVGADLTVEQNLVRHIAAVYDSDATADAGAGNRSQTIQVRSQTRLFVLDVPLLRDVDDGGGNVTVAYIGASAWSDDAYWPGCRIYVSADDTTYDAVTVSDAAVAWGACTHALGSTDRPWSTDEDNTLTVRMAVGGDSLESVSQRAMLNGANAAAILTANGEVEVIGYRDVVDNGDGTFTLSGLLRGQRGTEWAIGNHAAGDLFLRLDTSAWQAVKQSLDTIGVERFWRGVTIGTLLEDATRQSVTRIGRDLMPYAAVHLAAAVDGGDIALTWVRRTRMGGAWQDGTETMPLNEEAEAWEIDVLDGPAGDVLRTLSSTTASATYAGADIVTDFGAIPASLSFVVYQLSAVIGRGFPAAATIDLE
ncbi:phage tail protein [Roseospirillum parvum]|uniref:Putative phage tail protein n=1 Tax=Roseospirillum parvum TaxID=83401 RepID=A0A1G8EW76_9PROT|nr:phage tail protein [Roseospirillum parvum]SDH74104.1 Putative phage tail protein [Roseospirillum parvum]